MLHRLQPFRLSFGTKTLWISVTAIALCISVAQAEYWPVWRGPRGDGTSEEENVPIHWSGTSNVLWKTPIPGKGHASPVVWKNKIFTVYSVAETEERILICVDTESGKVLWNKTVLKSPMERKHSLNSHASSTPATDGKLVYTAFLDVNKMVVAAYDLDGNEKWKVNPGTFSSVHGFCSSPLLYKDKVIVNGDHDGDSYIVALDRSTGKTLWKTPRLNHTRSYCVPLLREMAGKTQMVLTGDKCVASYNPQDGKLIWMMDGPTEQFVASPVYSEKTKLVYITGGYPDHHILAIRPNGSGNIDDSHIAWRTKKGAAYVPSPIIEGDYFLIVSDSGVGHCFEASTGKLHWQERMGEHHASLTSANGLVYFLNDDGITHVVKPGPTYEVVAKNELGEKCFASPAFSNGRIFLRGDQHLYSIGSK